MKGDCCVVDPRVRPQPIIVVIIEAAGGESSTGLFTTNAVNAREKFAGYPELVAFHSLSVAPDRGNRRSGRGDIGGARKSGLQ
jgi:hypothetical protein